MVLESKSHGPGSDIIKCFVEEAQADLKSPITSMFGNKIAIYHQSVQELTESLDFDADGLQKLKKCVRDLYTAGVNLHQSEQELVLVLDQVANVNTSNSLANDLEPEIGAALLKYSVILKELSLLTKGVAQGVHNNLLFPLENLLKTEMKDKNELKKSVDRAVKDYETRFSKLEKDIKQQSKEAGWVRTTVTPADLAEDVAKERTVLQYELCKYYLVVSKIGDKKGIELLQHLVDYYHTQESYFHDGLKTMQEYRQYIESLVSRLSRLKQTQDKERLQLHELREKLRKSTHVIEHEAKQKRSSSDLASLPTTPLSISAAIHDISADFPSGSITSTDLTLSGFLWKKSNHKLHRQWQKRKCMVKNGCFYLNHSHSAQSPVEIRLVTCEVKASNEEKRCFDLFCYNRTYHFQAEDEVTMHRWLTAISSAKEMAQKELFSADDEASGNISKTLNGSVIVENRIKHIETVKHMSGNKYCADCGSTQDVTWVSTNLGALLCIDCSGVHRELGVHISRVQSLTLDRMTNAEFLIPLSVGNDVINSVYEELLPANAKILPDASGEARKLYIRSKYLDKRYVVKPKALDFYLEIATQEKDVAKMLRLLAAVPPDINMSVDSETGNTALIYLIEYDYDNSSLALVELLLSNGANPNCKNLAGNSALHTCIRYGRAEHMKLILRDRKVDLTVNDAQGRNPLQLANELNPQTLCSQLLTSAEKGEKSSFEDVYITIESTEPSTSTESSSQKPLSHYPLPIVTDDESGSISSGLESPITKIKPLMFAKPPPPAKPPLPPVSSAKPKYPHLYQRSASENQPQPELFGEKIEQEGSRQTSLSEGTRTLPGAKKVLPTLPPKPGNLHEVRSGSAHNISMSGKQSPDLKSTPPMPAPRKFKQSNSIRLQKRCRALYDCQADNEDELHFKQGEIILVTNEKVQGEDDRWMEGQIEGQPHRKGIFPVTFVTFEK